MGAGPFHNINQLVPIGDISERQGLYRRPGDNQRIKILITHIIQLPIKTAQIGRLGVAWRIAGGRHQDHLDLQWRISEQPCKLDLSVLFLRHQIQQQQPQWTDILLCGGLLGDDVDGFGLERIKCWQIIWNTNWHNLFTGPTTDPLLSGPYTGFFQ